VIKKSLFLAKFESLVFRHLGSISIGLFVLLFFLNYGFYLFVYPIPGFSNDAIQYFNAAFKILDGDLPLTDLPVDIPLGYPVFMSIFLKLKLDIINIVYAQILIMFVSSLLLVREVGKIHKFGGLLFSFLMGLWICDPNIMNHNTYFYPDSIFGSTIVLCVFFYLRYLRKGDLQSLICIAILL
jgi:hypothetical protein